jgi:hypothetical protein
MSNQASNRNPQDIGLAQNNNYQNSRGGFSFNQRANEGSANARPQPQSLTSIQSMRDKLLQTINRKDGAK